MVTVHEMKLNKKPFFEMLQGKKTVELRLNDEKRQQIKRAEYISFTLKAEDDDGGLNLIVAEVIALHKFNSFAELFETDLKVKSGFGDCTKDEAVQKMREYYSEDEERKYGVLGIELEVV